MSTESFEVIAFCCKMKIDRDSDIWLFAHPIQYSECDQEKCSLLERQTRAQAEVGVRRGQVDNMSTRLSSLARLHKTLVGNHGHSAASLDTLRAQLVAISKFVNTNKWQSFQQSFLNFSLQKPSSKKP